MIGYFENAVLSRVCLRTKTRGTGEIVRICSVRIFFRGGMGAKFVVIRIVGNHDGVLLFFGSEVWIFFH